MEVISNEPVFKGKVLEVYQLNVKMEIYPYGIIFPGIPLR